MLLPSIQMFLGSMVDYAGLFPPAQLPMGDAVGNYHMYREGAYDWMLGRLIVPADRLVEMEAAAEALLSQGASPGPWELSVLLGDDLETGARALDEFADRVARGQGTLQGAVASVELKTPDGGDWKRVADLAAGRDVYVELSLGENLEAGLQEIRDHGLLAKIRMGGITADAIPPVNAVADFLLHCRRARVAFKATAGLHHPVPGNYSLTYEPDSPAGVLHGFLSLFAAAAWLWQQDADDPGARDQVMRLLRLDSPADFRFDDDGLLCAGQRLKSAQLEAARREFAHSFGSCSFEEPVEDLKEAGIL